MRSAKSMPAVAIFVTKSTRRNHRARLQISLPTSGFSAQRSRRSCSEALRKSPGFQFQPLDCLPPVFLKGPRGWRQWFARLAVLGVPLALEASMVSVNFRLDLLETFAFGGQEGSPGEMRDIG